ncbi:uncharacterized protein LOC117033765 isoform X1 [Rhinolophus ferrumequinum]|uniref:uncharacterized protein LOC117033765 isoform X1 n=1 Tax=Rhinolophus ferrumequinum TaxID=59479 RepID=UPI00140F73ED|nr:uncharacterized protein LOC117033765 isoform X1 [Rhinolophus ferrumequinum]
MASQPSPRRSLASPRGPQAPLQEGKSRALFQAEVLHHVLGSGHQVPRPSLALGSPGTQKSALLKGPPPQSGVSFTLGRLRGSQTPRQEQSASVVALQCFTCREPSSLSSCVTITTCNANETMCQITVYSLETGVWKPRLGVTSQALLRITDSTLGMNWKPGPGIHGRDGKAQGLGMRSGPGAGRGLGNPRSVEWGQVLPCQPGP